MQRKGEVPRGDAGDRINIVGILGGGNRTSTANPFRGGDLIAVMGGGQVGPAPRGHPAGEQAIIDIMSMMGGFEIIVPESWVVDDRTMPIMRRHRQRDAPAADSRRIPSDVDPARHDVHGRREHSKTNASDPR